ncbi:ellis-van Creveld syndrome protein-like isoform X2 [Denticeps clupeoides]|uniref:ellis-van Creveld syndrome protein-like isoform X2 n=1 Tax=Denticeps clupeoides TaxID=299321 RepID=UPI0010A3C8D5|nr:ellis-van Creveld syndrome protein-like isoform X2 [Denticeps clupeoides]
MAPECASDVALRVAESLQLFTGLLTVAVAFGVFFGIVTATLLYVFCLKPCLQTRKFQGYDPRRLFDMEDGDRDGSQSDCSSVEKRPGQCGAPNERSKKQVPVSSDVAAFALKAKVVYPINQRFRPLADGASNPSLHEHSKLAVPPQPASSCSSSTMDSLSQEKDDGSSHFVSPSPPPTLDNETFQRVSYYPETVCQLGSDGRVSLYCLGLQDLHNQRSQLQEHKHELAQRKDLEVLRKNMNASLLGIEKLDDAGTASCSVDDVEKAGRERQEHAVQMAVVFSKQLEKLCQQLLGRRSPLPTAAVEKISQTLVESLLQLEEKLAECENMAMQAVLDRLQWWEAVAGCFRKRSALLRENVELRLKITARGLEQLTSDGQLTFTQMETLLSELQAVMAAELQCWNEGCRSRMVELVKERGRKVECKRRKLLKSHARDRSQNQQSLEIVQDPNEFIKLYHESLLRQMKQLVEFEMQQDGRITDALCTVWSVQRSWSDGISARWKEAVGAVLSASSQLSADYCQQLWRTLVHNLTIQLQSGQPSGRQQLQDIRSQLERDKQAWTDEDSLCRACLCHLAEQQMKITTSVVNSQKDLLLSADVVKKQRLLQSAFQRHFVARHFFLRGLREMRLSRLKLKPQESPDARELLLIDTEKLLDDEAQMVTQSHQHEFLSEVESASKLLQEYSQLLIGHALAWSVRQQLDATRQTSPARDDGRKIQLIEDITKSLSVSTVRTLVHNYYTEIRAVARSFLEENSKTDECEAQSGPGHQVQVLLKDLAHWARKPTSTAFQQRVELQKQRVLAQLDLEHQLLLTSLRGKRTTLDKAKRRFHLQLQEAEEHFMAELLASLPIHGADDCETPESKREGGSKNQVL